jgi:hypothetical protein
MCPAGQATGSRPKELRTPPTSNMGQYGARMGELEAKYIFGPWKFFKKN